LEELNLTDEGAMPIAMRPTFLLASVEWIALKRTPMHDFFVSVLFIAMVITPCVVALTARLDDRGSKYDR
jgi:hypothetical protein